MAVEGEYGAWESWTPYLRVGSRLDSGDGSQSRATELLGGLRYQQGRVEDELEGQWATAGVESGEEQYAVHASLTLHEAMDGRGLSFSLSADWGNALRQDDWVEDSGLWSEERLAAFRENADDSDSSYRVDGRMTWGVLATGMPRHLLRPFLEVSLSEDRNRYRIGLTLEGPVSGDLMMGHMALQDEDSELGIMLRVRAQF